MPPGRPSSVPSAQETDTEVPDQGSSGDIVILLVEDDVDHAHLIRRALPRDQGFKLTHVRTGSEALDAVDQRGFEACLVDYRLPDTEGVNLCGKLREAGFDGPLLLVTAVARESAVERAFDIGVDDYLIKDPAMMERLADEVRRHIEARQA